MWPKKHVAASLWASALQNCRRNKNAKEMCLEWGWGFSSVVQRLPSKLKALSSVLSSRREKKNQQQQQQQQQQKTKKTRKNPMCL
jgi:predicted nuclease of restriction endonuclease-like (RecB) superfamily